MIEMVHALTVLVHRSGDQHYILIFRPEETMRALEAVKRWAENPELGMTIEEEAAIAVRIVKHAQSGKAAS
jgi:hypothetical protein